MAESSLSVTYSELQDLVTRFAGWVSAASWTSQNTADFALILKRGLRRFYYPPPPAPDQPSHEWSFLRRENLQTIETGRNTYEFPDDFSGTVLGSSMAFQAGSAKSRLGEVAEWELMATIGKVASNGGTPAYYCIRPRPLSTTTGQRWEMVLYPTPSSAVNGSVLRYRYVVIPETLTSVQIYPWGGAAHSQTIIEAVLAAAEEYLDDDPAGIHAQKFAELLGASLRLDVESKQQTTPEIVTD